MIAHSRHLAAVLTWKPFAATAMGTATWLALAARPSPVFLSVAEAAVASAVPYVLDDPAAATLQPSPVTLRQRRVHRVALILPLLAAWWVLAATIVSQSTPSLPLVAHTMQLAALVAIGLAGASLTSRFGGDRTRGGTTGALAVIICFGTAFLPASSLNLVPNDPAAPGALRQFIVLFAVAVTMQLGGSTDPARRARARRRAPNTVRRSPTQRRL